MANESPKATSPLIDGSNDDDISAPEIVIDGAASDHVHVSSKKSTDAIKGTWSLRYHDIVSGRGAASHAKTFRFVP